MISVPTPLRRIQSCTKTGTMPLIALVFMFVVNFNGFSKKKNKKKLVSDMSEAIFHAVLDDNSLAQVG